MTRSTPHRGWMLWGVLLVCFLLVPALIAGCSDNKGSKGPSYGSSITGTATNGLFILSVNLNPNTVQPGQSAGITVLATTINGAPLEGRSVQLSTTGGTLSTVAGKTDAAGKFVATITSDVKDTSGAQHIIRATVDGVSVTGTLYIGVPGTLAILPASVTMAPGATQVFQASGGVEPYRWEPSGGTLNRHNEPTVIFRAGSETGTFTLVVRDAAGNSASATITISVILLTISPMEATLQPGQAQSFTVTGGSTPYSWNASGGSLNTTTGSSVTYTAGSATGTFTLLVRDAAGNSASATITISVILLTISPTEATLQPGQAQSFTVRGGTPSYTWTASGGTLNTSTGSSVTYTAGSSPGIFALVVRDAAGNSASGKITISLPALFLLPEDPVTRTYGATGDPPGTCSSSSIGTVTITFTVTGGVPPYTFSATYGTVTPSTRTTPGDVNYSITPGALTGGTERTEYITVLDSAGQRDTSKVTIECKETTS